MASSASTIGICSPAPMRNGSKVRARTRWCPNGIRSGGRRFAATARHVCAIRCGYADGESLPWSAASVYGTDSRFFSPSGGFAVGRVFSAGAGSVYRSFRAPTLNELYRDFRAGNAETRANADPSSGDSVRRGSGCRSCGRDSRLGSVCIGMRSPTSSPMSTLSSTPALIVRQRQNAASALARGIDAQGDYRRGPWRLDLGYLYH